MLGSLEMAEKKARASIFGLMAAIEPEFGKLIKLSIGKHNKFTQFNNKFSNENF